MAQVNQNHSTSVVISGIGLVTPLGITAEQTWTAIRAGRCGFRSMSAMEAALPPGADGGQAPDLPADFEPRLPRETRYLRRAILDAIQSAKANPLPYAPARCGIVLGTTLHGMRAGGQFLRGGDAALLSTFLAAPVLRDAITGLDLHGFAATTCSACSSSLGAIVQAVSMLRSGELDLIIAGGYDAISEYAYAGFNSLRLVTDGALRPFARDRRGMKLAEGYGIVVLERQADSTRRGATPIAQILGYGESADAHHLTQPHPQGSGAAQAIGKAIERAGIARDSIGLIAAHATGTPDNDAGEYAALATVFGDSLPKIPVVGFKSHLGHTLGGAGAVELILSAMALRDQVVPGCVNVAQAEVDFPGLRLSTGAARAANIFATLNTSLGFGGANTSVVMSSARNDNLTYAATTRRDVFISGVGVVFPEIVGNAAFLARLNRNHDPVSADTGNVDDAEILPLLNARRIRRMSDYVKITLASAALCLRDADIDTTDASLLGPCAAVLGTAHGSSNYCEAYYRPIVEQGIIAANPMLFAEGVPNAGAAHLSLMLGIKGPCQSVIGSRTAGLDAMRIAMGRIASGEWGRALVTAADEHSPIVNQAYGRHGLYGAGGFRAGAGAVTLLLESESALSARRGSARAKVLAGAGSIVPRPSMPRLARHIFDSLGEPASLFGCANGTWIDRVERAGFGKLPTLYGPIAECYSAMPLAHLAAVLLQGEHASLEFAVVACDYAGGVVGIGVERVGG
jgi:3-oxoacyl-[acyl-carrier-protein] synthase II